MILRMKDMNTLLSQWIGKKCSKTVTLVNLRIVKRMKIYENYERVCRNFFTVSTVYTYDIHTCNVYHNNINAVGLIVSPNHFFMCFTIELFIDSFCFTTHAKPYI